MSSETLSQKVQHSRKGSFPSSNSIHTIEKATQQNKTKWGVTHTRPRQGIETGVAGSLKVDVWGILSNLGGVGDQWNVLGPKFLTHEAGGTGTKPRLEFGTSKKILTKILGRLWDKFSDFRDVTRAGTGPRHFVRIPKGTARARAGRKKGPKLVKKDRKSEKRPERGPSPWPSLGPRYEVRFHEVCWGLVTCLVDTFGMLFVSTECEVWAKPRQTSQTSNRQYWVLDSLFRYVERVFGVKRSGFVFVQISLAKK